MARCAAETIAGVPLFLALLLKIEYPEQDTDPDGCTGWGLQSDGETSSLLLEVGGVIP